MPCSSILLFFLCLRLSLSIGLEPLKLLFKLLNALLETFAFYLCVGAFKTRGCHLLFKLGDLCSETVHLLDRLVKFSVFLL